MSQKRKRSIFDIIKEYFEGLDEWAESIQESLIEGPSWNQRTCAVEPLRDIKVTPMEVIVTVDLPYAEENTVQVKPLDTDLIEISAKMKRKIRLGDFGITQYGGEFRSFQCQTRIPVPVKIDKMEVRFKKGFLEIHLPRKHGHYIPIE